MCNSVRILFSLCALLLVPLVAQGQQRPRACTNPELLHWRRTHPEHSSDSAAVKPPAVLSFPRGIYPAALRNTGWGGTVVLAILLDSTGAPSVVEPVRVKVRNVAIYQAPHDPGPGEARRLLERAAWQAGKAAHFRPATKKGRPIPILVCLPVIF